jgi:hypothetical protein
MRYIIAIILLFVLGETRSQKIEQPEQTKRAKDNFDSNWHFHRGDIAMKPAKKPAVWVI